MLPFFVINASWDPLTHPELGPALLAGVGGRPAPIGGHLRWIGNRPRQEPFSLFAIADPVDDLTQAPDDLPLGDPVTDEVAQPAEADLAAGSLQEAALASESPELAEAADREVSAGFSEIPGRFSPSSSENDENLDPAELLRLEAAAPRAAAAAAPKPKQKRRAQKIVAQASVNDLRVLLKSLQQEVAHFFRQKLQPQDEKDVLLNRFALLRGDSIHVKDVAFDQSMEKLARMMEPLRSPEMKSVPAKSRKPKVSLESRLWDEVGTLVEDLWQRLAAAESGSSPMDKID